MEIPTKHTYTALPLLAGLVFAGGFAANTLVVSLFKASPTRDLQSETTQLQLDLGRMRDDVCRRAGPNEVKAQGSSFLGREWRFSANAIDPQLPDYARYGYTHVGCNAQSLDADKLAFTYMVTRPEESVFIPK